MKVLFYIFAFIVIELKFELSGKEILFHSTRLNICHLYMNSSREKRNGVNFVPCLAANANAADTIPPATPQSRGSHLQKENGTFNRTSFTHSDTKMQLTNEIKVLIKK